METVKGRADQRVILHNISWETYERLLDERGDSRVPRFAYDRGELEIMSPSPEHESLTAYFSRAARRGLAEEMGIDAYGVGSTTFQPRRSGARLRARLLLLHPRTKSAFAAKTRIDLDVDPPPDLVIEVDITSPSLDKFPIYAPASASPRSGATTENG